MALVVLAARAFLSSRIARWTFPLLWTLVFTRFLLLIELPVSDVASGLPLLRRHLSVWEPVLAILGVGSDAGATTGASYGADEPAPKIAFIIWAVGAALALAGVLSMYVRRADLLGRTRDVSDTPHAKDWALTHRLRRRVCVVESGWVAAPATYGCVHPIIVVPEGFLDGPPAQTRAVLEHEFAHIRRFDSTIRALALVAACLYWFNPLVWIAYFVMRTDQELACDAAVIRRLGEHVRKPYADALLDAAEVAIRSRPLWARFGQSPLALRIRAIVSPVRHRILPAITTTVLVTLFALSSAACLSQAPGSHIEIGSCSLQLPSLWDDRIDVYANENEVIVSLKGHPDIFLIELVRSPSDESSRITTVDYRMLWSGTDAEGVDYELWGLCYPGMSIGNAWQVSPSSNPSYPGVEAEREAVYLSTGGSVTADGVRSLSEMNPSWFDFYYTEIVPTVRVE